MLRCDICGREADKHHIVHRCEGGLEYPLNIRYLCEDHHRGINGPHRCNHVDLKYKLELQNKLEQLLDRDYYTIKNLSLKLEIKTRILKKILKEFKLYKEGYKKEDIIYVLMGRKIYDDFMLESYYDFIPIYKFA